MTSLCISLALGCKSVTGSVVAVCLSTGFLGMIYTTVPLDAVCLLLFIQHYAVSVPEGVAVGVSICLCNKLVVTLVRAGMNKPRIPQGLYSRMVHGGGLRNPGIIQASMVDCCCHCLSSQPTYLQVPLHNAAVPAHTVYPVS
ncbi:hypothetical protein B0T25DRAFT_49900 [Lasiosphaeria hispida]|uniref:Uncharacterized protein n=1 Tax=Lasiosphaeria hispida TaxID=260671 RepID=A0AAJ0MKC9_9PEZI|nr:hypothetical protein B0T25DRAFT_49900 [Lasiosphaeria hispida]